MKKMAVTQVDKELIFLKIVIKLLILLYFACFSIRNRANHMIFSDLEMLKYCPHFLEMSCDFDVT